MDSRVDFLGHFCFLFCIFHCNTWLLTSVVEINMNTPSASRGLSRVLGSVAWGIERLRAAAEQEITFGHEEHQEHQEHQGPQADLNGDGAVCSNSNRASSDQAPAGDQHRSRDSRASGGGGDTDYEFGSNGGSGNGDSISTGGMRSSHNDDGRGRSQYFRHDVTKRCKYPKGQKKSKGKKRSHTSSEISMVLGIAVDSNPSPPPALSWKRQQSKFVNAVPAEDV